MSRDPISVDRRTCLCCRVFGCHAGGGCFGFRSRSVGPGARLALLREVRSDPNAVCGVEYEREEATEDEVEEKTGKRLVLSVPISNKTRKTKHLRKRETGIRMLMTLAHF